MGYYAAYLDVSGKRCLVVGGGDEAAAKVQGLLTDGAAVTVIAGTLNTALEELVAEGGLEVERRGFEEGDLNQAFLVIDASGDDASGERVAAAARARHVLVNVLDRPRLCDFIAPALVRRGRLQVAVSTSGRSPFLASLIRRRLEGEIGEEYGELVDIVGALRDRMRADGVPLDRQNQVYARIEESGALELLRDGRRAEAEAAVNGCTAGLVS
ncbi:MAG: bifunctional precorrin-2 dehydrogenase/sirohydrochlorin ferrochelatase [Candidatus Dormiibacterota bacterium]